MVRNTMASRVSGLLLPAILCMWMLCSCSDEGSGGADPVDESNGSHTPWTAPDLSGETEPEPPIVEVPDGPMSGRAPMRLLTRYEYNNTIADLLGFAGLNVSENFPPENLVEGFENNAWMHKVSPSGLRYYLEAAEFLSERVLEDPPPMLLPCVNISLEESGACKAALWPFLGQAFRRPPHDEEVASLMAL